MDRFNRINAYNVLAIIAIAFGLKYDRPLVSMILIVLGCIMLLVREKE